MEGLDAKRIFAHLQLEGEEFLLTSPFIELLERDSSSKNGWLPKNTVFQLFLSKFLNVAGGPAWMRTRSFTFQPSLMSSAT
jgi:hypothetical protein